MISVALSGAPPSLFVTASSQLTAVVSGSTDQTVTWLVNGTAGGNATSGTITSTGLYTAPAITSTSASPVVVTAASRADSTKSASVSIAVLYPVPVTSSIAPSSVAVGSAATVLAISGSSFTPSTGASLNGVTLATTFINSTQLSAIVPSSLEASPGTASLITSNPTPGGGTSTNAAPFIVTGGTLAISIIDLPPGTAGDVVLTDANGNKRPLSASASLALPVGSYTITANPVKTLSSSFYPRLTSQVAVVSNGSASTIAVDYNTQIPVTTKVLDDVGKAGLVIAANSSSLSLPQGSGTAANLAAGDVLVASTSPSAPGGVAVRILSVSRANGLVTATTVPAALTDIFQRASIDTDIVSYPTTKFAAVPAVQASPLLSDPCNGQAPITVTHDFNTLPGLDVASQLEVCPSIHFHVDIGATGVSSASFLGNFAQYGQITVTGGSFSLLDKELDLMPLISPPVVLDIAGVPVEFTLSATVYVHPTLTVVGGFQIGGSESYTGQAGVTYANGQWTPVKSQQAASEPSPVIINASADAKLAAGVKFAVNLYQNFASVYFAPEEYLELKADLSQNPWWTRHHGIEGTMGLEVQLFGHDLTNLPSFQLFDLDTVDASAPGPFLAQVPTVSSFTPLQANAGSADLGIVVTGTNFVPGNTVVFGGVTVLTSWISPTQLNSTLPQSVLAVPGTYSIGVADSASRTTVMAPSVFKVTGGVLSSISVTPSTIYAGTTGVGKVTLGIPAPAASAVIFLTSSAPSTATVPASVTIPAGQTSATFPVVTAKVSSPVKVTLSAAYGSDQASSAITVSGAIALLFPGSSMLGVNPQRTNTTTAIGPRSQPVFLPLITGINGGMLRRIGADGTLIVTYAQSCGTTNTCGTIAAYTASGVLKWSSKLALTDGSGFSDVAVAPSGTVYATTYYGQEVIALNASTGATLWRVPINTGGNESGDLLLDPAGNIYAQTSSSQVGPTPQLTSLAADGTIRWNIPVRTRAYNYAALSIDGTTLYLNGDQGQAYSAGRVEAYSAATGGLTAAVTCQISSLFAVDPSGGYGVLSSNHYAFFPAGLGSCADLESGSNALFADKFQALTNNGVLISSIGNTTTGTSLSGGQLWSYPQPLTGGIADASGTLYELLPPDGQASNTVLAFDALTGTQLWQVVLPESGPASNILMGPDGSLYVLSGTKIYKANP